MSHIRSASVALGSILLLLGPAARANDGFYQGAGHHLVPVKSRELRVVREILTISALDPPRCYPILLDGKPLPPWKPDGELELERRPPAGGLLLSPRPGPCEPSWIQRNLVAHWRAEAEYTVEAKNQGGQVQLGFPVPRWGFEFMVSGEGLDSEDLPAAANFETFVDGQKISRTAIRELELTTARGESTLGYVWTASLTPSRGHTLRSTYDFGVDYSNGFYEGREYKNRLRPWFVPERSQGPGAVHLRYYLSPLRSWAEPAPDSVDVRVDLPRSLPATHVVPVAMQPTCVDARALFFQLDRAYPVEELDLAYPSPVPERRLRSRADWTRWTASVNGTQVTCRFRDEVMAGADEELQGVLRPWPCVASCDRGRPGPAPGAVRKGVDGRR